MIRLLILLVIFANNSFAQDLLDTRKVCESEKGVWREFGNDCADNCHLDRGYKKMCISKITFSCDCLENRCWDYYQCVDDEKYQIMAQKLERERIEKVKESNPELFIENRKVYVRQDTNNPNSVNDVNSSQSYTQPTNNPSNPNTGSNLSETDQISSCAGAGGVWKKFSNGCADSCSSKAGPAICSTVITESCDCGDDRCWNGATCLLTSSY